MPIYILHHIHELLLTFDALGDAIADDVARAILADVPLVIRLDVVCASLAEVPLVVAAFGEVPTRVATPGEVPRVVVALGVVDALAVQHRGLVGMLADEVVQVRVDVILERQYVVAALGHDVLAAAYGDVVLDAVVCVGDVALIDVALAAACGDVVPDAAICVCALRDVALIDVVLAAARGDVVTDAVVCVCALMVYSCTPIGEMLVGEPDLERCEMCMPVCDLCAYACLCSFLCVDV